MILAPLDRAADYASLHPGLAAGFDFLQHAPLAELAAGKYAIDGERVFAIVEQAAGRGHSGARLEAHRRYIDIQVSLDGQEWIGWRPLADCRAIETPYTADRDIAFWSDAPALWLPLGIGQFMVFFPADAHAPLAGTGPLAKVVIKVAVER